MLFLSLLLLVFLLFLRLLLFLFLFLSLTFPGESPLAKPVKMRIAVLRVCRYVRHVSHSLNSLKGGYTRDYIGDYYRAIKGDTRSLDSCSCRCDEIVSPVMSSVVDL